MSDETLTEQAFMASVLAEELCDLLKNLDREEFLFVIRELEKSTPCMKELAKRG